MSETIKSAGQATGALLAIVVNGQERNAKAGDTVTDLLAALGLENGRVAIERNLKILPRARVDGDKSCGWRPLRDRAICWRRLILLKHP